MKKMLLAASACLVAACVAQSADLDFLKELVEIPSSSIDYPQVNRAMRAMKAYLEKRGLFCTVETDDDGRELLFAATKPGKVQDYVISAHLDVVPASYEGQYTFKNENGRLSGRGVGDDKGGSLAVAQALAALAGKDVSVGCIFGADEELGGFTTTWMVEKMGYRPRKMVIVVDSAYGKIGYATKGQLMVRATITGKGGHSSAPWNCEDLITQLSSAVVKIKEEWYRRHPMADGPDHWSDVLTPTIIHSEGTALNRIPSEVWVNFNLRSVRPEAKDECIQLVREVTGGKVEVVRYSPPCVTDGDNPYVLRLKKAMEAELKAPVPLERMPFATDARCFVSCNVPVVNIGHEHGDAHGATEWANADSIDVVTRYLTAFLLAE
ncbi:MAG: M20/M25/M40 family metallo-hydrolase [Kiritimatiellae bacterium]|nr:M20/M25/M40 family metallo-hydrolase [Kiritimatiellia bacterium]